MVDFEDYELLDRVASELLLLRTQIEDRFEASILDQILNQCWKARRAIDPKFGNVIEQITRVETGVKLARKGGNTSDLYQAITRVRGALDIHKRAIAASMRI